VKPQCRTTKWRCPASNRRHDVEFYFDAGGELSTKELRQQVRGVSETCENATALRIGTITQDLLGRAGDDLRIDWGYLYVAAAKRFDHVSGFGEADEMREAFDEKGAASLDNDKIPFPVEAESVVAAIAMPMGKTGKHAVSCYALIAYDDLYSIEFMRHKLRPYWRKDGWKTSDLIIAAINDHDSLEERCQEFDRSLMTDLEASGGRQYAEIGALAFRQCFAAGKFVSDANGQPLQFCKENHSNGCIATSDVFYPMAPQFLLFGPTLTKSMLVPFREYAASERWRFPFAPQDLGTYPKANGPVYGGGERSVENQMPVEECGNLLTLFCALAQMEGNADFAATYWNQLNQWADYLREEGFDPDNQLCTDDLAGHMAHNVNLSAKAICGLGSHAMLCEIRGMNDDADKYRGIARRYAAQWVDAARDDDHFRLAFDREGTWSQKYNLVWDRLLNLGLFLDEVYRTEMDFYRKRQNAYGLPLDYRADYTKLDWILWTATLTEDRDDFETLVRPVHRFLNETPDRSPMTDWYFTSTARKRGFTARPVVGGVFMKLLFDSSTWKTHASGDVTRSADWAPMPRPPQTVTLVPTSETAETNYRYPTERPADNWFAVAYHDSKWESGRGGLDTAETPGAPVNTRWASSDVWVRRTVRIPATAPDSIVLRIWHDEDAEVYLNGKPVLQLAGYSTEYDLHEIPATSLKHGDNVVAIHCHQSTGGQHIDFGIDAIVPTARSVQ
jgi:hypothetical protein